MKLLKFLNEHLVRYHNFQDDRLITSKWDQYWNSTKINYGNSQVWAKYFVESYEKYFGFSRSDIILDFGTGIGDIPLLVKDKVQKIYLFEKSKVFVDILRKRFDRFQDVYILNDVQEINESVSVIIINSVIQYMNRNEVENMLSNLLKISNLKTKIIISDILPSGYTKLADAIYLLKTSIKNGFFLRFVSSMITNILYSPKLSFKTSTLQIYDENELKKILLKHGYDSIRMEKNFAYSTHRYTLYCKLTDKK